MSRCPAPNNNGKLKKRTYKIFIERTESMFTACATKMCAISGSVLNQAITFDAVGFFQFCFFFLVIYMHRQILRILTTAHLSHNHLRLNIDIQMDESVQNVRFFSLFDTDLS